ncbi:MAG: hypothetical protein BI182_05855 [Acetobacterium sp. MES1]|nr:MAG: hypothetical protein BI182_05855 [Acetobacterium sp. MES1]
MRSIGELFYWSCDELADITYQESYLLLIELMLSVCQDILHLSDEKMGILLDQFLKNLPVMIKSSLKPCA